MSIDLFNDPIEILRNARRAGFSRMFGWLPPHDPGTKDPKGELRKLADRFYDAESTAATDVNLNARLPAAYAFFAQLVAHDLSFDPSTPGQVSGDDSTASNGRTPRLDLDMVYGGDPDLNLDYYEEGKLAYFFRFGGGTNPGVFDFPRDRKRALIPDQRDDQHVIISQLHVALMRLHNEHLARITMDQAHPAGPGRQATLADFREAQRRTRWYYQYVIVNDLLPRLLGDRQVQEVLEPAKARWLARQASMSEEPSRKASVPLEFTVAVYRIGHSVIRAFYKVNAVTDPLPLFPDGPPVAAPPNSLMGHGPLHSSLVVRWDHLLKVPGFERNLQLSRRFGPRLPRFFKLIPELAAEGGLAGRDLERGRVLGLPSGQDVARRLGLPTSQIKFGNDPLWYYVMKEVPDGGFSVGPVAARILSRVFLDVLHLDPNSYLARDPAWSPTSVSDPANALLQLMRDAKMPISVP